jgi:hypothetical protein
MLSSVQVFHCLKFCCRTTLVSNAFEDHSQLIMVSGVR